MTKIILLYLILIIILKKHFSINDYFSGHRKVYIGNLFEKIKLKKNKIKKQQKEINFYIGTVEEEYFAGMNAN